MLKGIDPRLSAELVHALMLMGHGDDLVICDVNHPAATIAADTTYGRLIDLPGCDIPEAAAAILSLMPLDSFVPAPVWRMEVVGDPDGVVPVFGRMQAVIDQAEGRAVSHGKRWSGSPSMQPPSGPSASCGPSDPGPYGCFILRKGVIDLPRRSEPSGQFPTPERCRASARKAAGTADTAGHRPHGAAHAPGLGRVPAVDVPRRDLPDSQRRKEGIAIGCAAWTRGTGLVTPGQSRSRLQPWPVLRAPAYGAHARPGVARPRHRCR